MVALLKFSFILVYLCKGGFYGWGAAALGIFLSIAVLIEASGKSSIPGGKRKWYYFLPIGFLLLQILVTIWAVDSSYHITGILMSFDGIIWFYLCSRRTDKEREEILSLVPFLGAGTVLLGLIFLISPSLKEYLWQAKRLGGLFQYSNTLALFLSAGIMLNLRNLYKKEGDSNVKRNQKKRILEYVLLGIQSAGLLLTGSRSVILLLLLWAVYKAVRTKNYRLPLAAGSAAILILAFVFALITGSFQNVGRIFTIFTQNSTVWGRLLYDIDGLKMLIRHPFGMGYMGYYYLQGAEQSGVYTTRFVHNDLLQAGLDYGIPAMLIICFFVAIQIVKGRQESELKEMFILCLAASLVDFHMQYPVLLLLMGCLFDYSPYIVISPEQSSGKLKNHPGKKKRNKKMRSGRKGKPVVVCALIPCLILFIYFFFAFTLQALGNTKASLVLFPGNTQALEQRMEGLSDRAAMVELAEQIVKGNPYHERALNVLAYDKAMDGEYNQAMEYKDRIIAVKKYDVKQYAAYDALLADMFQSAMESSQEDMARKILERKEELPKELEALKESTNILAYKIKDKPEFDY